MSLLCCHSFMKCLQFLSGICSMFFTQLTTPTFNVFCRHLHSVFLFFLFCLETHFPIVSYDDASFGCSGQHCLLLYSSGTGSSWSPSLSDNMFCCLSFIPI